MRYAKRWYVALAVAACCACSQSPPDPAAAPPGFGSAQTRVPGEYLVTLAEGADVKAIAAVYGRFGIKATRSLGNNLFLVTLAEDPGPEKLAELRSAQVKAIQPN